MKHAFLFAWHEVRWKFWLWPFYMIRYSRFLRARAEMEALGMPDDEMEVLRRAWLFGEDDGYTEYPECQECWIRFDPRMEVNGKRAQNGICVPCQEKGERAEYLECDKCHTFYDPTFVVMVGEDEEFIAREGICASCWATERLQELALIDEATTTKETEDDIPTTTDRGTDAAPAVPVRRAGGGTQGRA